jgi:hypothetical protein
MAKVYVSSTIADLKAERQAVLDWLRLARHQAVDSYLPGSDTVRDSCLEDVAACDLYVLILGHWYGFAPADGNPGGLSITHLEFRRAGECSLPRVALLRTSIPDVSLSDLADPQRLALVSAFRAEVAREVRPAEFSDLQGLIQGLSTGIQGELDKRERRDKRPGGQARAGPALRLAPRPVFLAGRQELLADLDVRLAGNDTGPQVIALCGLAGAGKTSAAVEYAYRHLAEVGVLWQFPAEDATVLAAGFAELAAQLGARRLADARDPVASVHAVLANVPVPWLLIFDNAANMASVAPFLPPAGTGRVLITSQNPNWPGQVLDIPVLTLEVAARFLADRTGASDRQAAAELASELGGLPLALEQAASYVVASGENLAGYLALFRQRRPDLLARGEPTGYSKTVAATWSLAFEQLLQTQPEAIGLLRLIACCAPEAVPLRLLLRSRPWLAGKFGTEVAPTLISLLNDPLGARDAIAGLRRYSLVTPAGDGSVSVHRLVQAVTVDQMPAELGRQWQQAAAVLIEDAIPGDTDSPETWQVCAVLLPHAQVALADDGDGMARIVHYLGSSGNYGAARDLQRRVLDARERILGPEHPHTLIARRQLARWTGEAGDPAAAQDLLAGLLPVFERVLGPEHRHTLGTRHQLARWTGHAGDPAAARDLFAELLPVRERIQGPEHPHTLAIRYHVATWAGEAGDPAAARDLLAALIPVRERVQGTEHQETLITRYQLAIWTGKAGNPAAARDLLAALLPVFERVLGPEHPRTLTTRYQLASWTGKAGNPAAARDLLAALLRVFERVLGPEHPHTVTTRHALAIWTGHADDGSITL